MHIYKIASSCSLCVIFVMLLIHFSYEYKLVILYRAVLLTF